MRGRHRPRGDDERVGVPMHTSDGHTTSGDRALEHAVAEQVGRLADRIVDSIGVDLPFALLLTGGFGRGEGTATLRNGRLRIQNDYDFELVLDTSVLRFPFVLRGLHRSLDRRLDELARSEDIKQIDVGIKCLELLRWAAPTIALYELEAGHEVVRGSRRIASQIPRLPASEIPMTEGARLILNRGGGLLMAAVYASLDMDVGENYFTEISKALLATGDLELLMTGRYHISYRERARRVLESEGWATSQAARELYGEAVAYKLRWDHTLVERAPGPLLVTTRDVFLTAVRRFESKRLAMPFANWLDYERLRKPRHESLLLDLGRCVSNPARLRLAARKGWPWVRDGHEAALLGMLPGLLAPLKWTTGKGLVVDADLDVWLQDCSLFLEVWHPAGEAGRLASHIRGRLEKTPA